MLSMFKLKFTSLVPARFDDKSEKYSFKQCKNELQQGHNNNVRKLNEQNV